jgi:hypothetical protein
MNEPEKAGQVYFVDLKAEIQEIERLGLEEGLQLLKTLTLRLEPKGTNILGFGSYSEKEKAARDRATSVLQEVYMGQFEVSDAAVNLAMMNLREESVLSWSEVTVLSSSRILLSWVPALSSSRDSEGVLLDSLP